MYLTCKHVSVLCLVSALALLLKNLTDGRRYRCTLILDWETPDGYDCTADPKVGDRTFVWRTNAWTGWCTGGEFGNIGTGEHRQCSYNCSMAP